MKIEKRATGQKYASKIIELEVWIQKELFKLKQTPMPEDQRKEQHIILCCALGAELTNIYPELQNVINVYMQIASSFNSPPQQVSTELLGRSLQELNSDIAQYQEQISRFEDEFEQKQQDLEKVLREIQMKRTELDSLRLLNSGEIIPSAQNVE